MVDGKPHLAMPREIQRDHIHNTLIHVDFLAVSRTEKIAVDVPVIEVGDAAGVKEGGVVEHHLRDLHIESPAAGRARAHRGRHHGARTSAT